MTSHDVADIEHVADRAIVVNHGSIIYDDSVQAMRQTFLRTKRVEVRFAGPVDQAALHQAVNSRTNAKLTAAVILTAVSPTTATLQVDTNRRPIREVLDQVLRHGPVADLTVVDPPLEQVIGDIYQRPQHVGE